MTKEEAYRLLDGVSGEIYDQVFYEYDPYEWTEEEYRALTMVIKTLKNLPSAQPEQRWIPVDEGRPKGETVCLVTDSKGLVEIATFAEDLYEFDEYDFHDKRGVAGWICFDDEWGRYFDVDNVVAWMPLPEPYQSEA